MARKKLLQDSDGQIWPITTADCVYLSDGSKTVKKYIDDKLDGKANSSHNHTVLTVKSDNWKDSAALPSTYDRGETLFFSNNPSSNKFNSLTYGMVQTLKEYGSGPAAWQFLYPYNASNDKFYVRNAQYNTDSWRSWAEVYTSLNKPTPDDIGAAASSHGTHVTWSTTTPKANGTAAVGSETKVARGDHIHPLQTTVSGNAGTATKLATARTLTIGSKGKTFDGSANVSWSLSEIGAAASSHSHNVITNQDTRDVNTAPADVPVGLSVHLKNNGIDGLTDGGTYHPSLMIKPWDDKSGWPIGQLSVTQNNNLWFRSSKADGTSWNDWKKVSLNGHTHSYLPLTGGTLSGRLHADGKLSVRARGGSWIDTVNFDNVAIANNTEPSNGAYYPLLAARTEGMHTISLGSNYTSFGFYGFKNGRTENGVDLQFTFDVNGHSTYTNTWMNIDNGMDVTGEINASLFRPKYAPGSQNCYIGGGSGDAADWDNHNMVIRSHWGIGFHDYQNICRIVFCTRSGNINTKGLLYSEGGVSTTQWIHANGSLSADGGASLGGHTYINAMSVSDKITGETKFSVDGAWGDPWENVGCAIKAHGHIATNYTVKAGYLNAAQQELNGYPSRSQSFLRIDTGHDGNGQGDAQTHLGYNNGDGYHHFFRGTGAMHINMHQGVQISNNFISLAGIPLTISGNAPSIGGVWIQI